MHLSILCPTTPLLGDVDEEAAGNLKIQMHHLLGMPVSEITTFSSPIKKMEIYEGVDLRVIIHTSTILAYVH